MKNTEWRAGPEMPGASGKQNHCQVELQTKVHTNHGEGPHYGLLLVESGYYRFHI